MDVCKWIYDMWMIYRCNLIYAMMIEVKISNTDDNDEFSKDERQNLGKHRITTSMQFLFRIVPCLFVRF